MTLSVVIHHVAVIYGVEGGWYYSEYAGDTLSQIFLTFVTFMVRAFVLQYFFFIAAFFTPSSYDRKGPVIFMKDRLVKLGIPLVVYSYLIGPTITYLVKYNTLSTEYSFMENIYQFRSVAPAALWFVEVLIIFSFLYVLWRLFTKTPASDRKENKDATFPSNAAIMSVVLALGFITFLVRLYFPATYKIFHLRPGNYPTYIAMFILGVIAYRQNWLAGISHNVYKFWLRVLAFAMVIFIGVIIFDGALQNHTVLYRGGRTWQGLFGAVWENVMNASIIITSLYLGRKYDNAQGTLIKAMSKDAFAVYVFHAPVVVAFTYYAKDLPLCPILKFAFVSVAAISFTFFMCHYFIRKLPLADRVF